MLMHKANCQLEFINTYCQSRFHDTPKLPKELPIDYESRTWMERLHVRDGHVFVPALSLKNCLSECAKFLSIQVPGKGKSTYTKHFEAGIGVFEDCPLAIAPEQIVPTKLFLPADGVRGSGKRVIKYYPVMPPGLKFNVEFLILDSTITKSVFLQHLAQAGQLIGLGTFRVRNNGTMGRFRVLDFKWSEYNA